MVIRNVERRLENSKKGWWWKVPSVILMALIVMLGVFSVFAQFDSRTVPEDNFVHNNKTKFTYFEWDTEGNQIHITPIYNSHGFISGFEGSPYLDALSGGIEKPIIPDDEIPDDEIPVGKVDGREIVSNEIDGDLFYEEEMYPARHRFGFSIELTGDIKEAILTLDGTQDVPFVAFLGESIIYSFYQEEGATPATPPLGWSDSVTRLASKFSIYLPTEYTGETLTIVEYLLPEQALYWDPIIPTIGTDETNAVLAVISYGPSAIFGGMIAVVVLILMILFIRQFFSGRNPFLLFLPIIYALLYMIIKSSYVAFHSTGFLQSLYDLIAAFLLYSAGDLLIIFLLSKMERKLRIGAIIITIGHFIIATGGVIKKYMNGDFLLLNSEWIGIYGFLIIVLAIVLLFVEQKKIRYLKYAGWMFVSIIAIYMAVTFVFYFADPGLYIEFSAPIDAAINSFHFFHINQTLAVFMMITITLCSAIEYVLELTENSVRLNTLEQVNRLKTEFLGNVSHELKTPLTVMSSYAQLSEKRVENQEGAEDIARNMKLIKSEAERLSLMVEQILDVTRIEENKLHISVCPCDISEIITTTLDTYYPVFRKNRNELIYEPLNETVEVICDPNRIIQVLVNLISNAAKHTQNGKIIVRVLKEKELVAVEVKDNGKGMTAQQIEHAFDRYYTKSGSKEILNTGTGLGLYICQFILKEHKQDIKIESIEGEGTTVRFTLQRRT